MRIISVSITMSVFLLLCTGAEAQIALQSQFSERFKPVIDGQISEWLADNNGLDGSLFALGRGERVGGAVQSRGDEDISAEYALAHNREALALAISFKDERQIRAKKASLNNDHIELWFGVTVQNTNKVEALGLAFFMDPSNDKQPVEAYWLSSSKRRRSFSYGTSCTAI